MADVEHDISHDDCDAITCTIMDGDPCPACDWYNDLEADIVDATARVLEAEQALEELIERRRLCHATMNSNHDLLTTRLPVEVVSEIFKLAVTRELKPGLKKHVIESPLYLGAVCQSWRTIAWSTPGLWNWIHIFLRRPVNAHLEETVQQWIKRSGQLPLTIQVTCGTGIVNVVDMELFLPQTGVFGDLVHHINHCSVRWENVSFTCPSSMIEYLHGSDHHGTPNLKVFRVSTTDVPDHHRFPLAEFEACSLNSLTMGGPMSPRVFDYDSTLCHWDNLVDIYLADFSEDLCIQAIKRMPHLIQCVLICDGQARNDINNPPVDTIRTRFVHKNLEKFTFQMINPPHSVRHIFNYFVFPNLTHLSIIYKNAPERTINFGNGQALTSLTLWEKSVKPFLLKCSSNLRSLELQVPCEYTSLLDILEEADRISTLTLKDATRCRMFDFHSFLLRLASAPRDALTPKFLGNLKFLSISGQIKEPRGGISAFEAILNACARSLDRRDLNPRPLQQMVVRARKFEEMIFDDENLLRVPEIIAAGINVQVIDRFDGEDFLKPYRTLRH